jgi:demethylmenaquinone methyltransferase/2-methoxy-6-polyprenyl-1,4-benzoquinol methylase
MVANAKVPEGVRLLLGSAERLPLADSSADFLSMGYALRHLRDLTAAFDEFFRVLKPGGLLCVLEFTLPQGRLPRALLKGYMRGVVPWLAAALAPHHDMPKLMRYTWETIEACVPPRVVVQGIEGAGFSHVSRHVELGIFSEYRACKPID